MSVAVGTLLELLAGHPPFDDLDPRHVRELAGCGEEVAFAPGDVLFREGEEANTWFLVRDGRVALRLAWPGRAPITLQTVGAGDIVGWSWLFPPYRWTSDAVAVDETHAVAFDGRCIRLHCDEDAVLGRDLMLRFAQIATQRLQAARLQLLDLYGHGRDR